MTADLHSLFGERPKEAKRFGPQTRPEFMQAAASMAAGGLGVDDIAAALNLSRAGVTSLLRDHMEAERQRFHR